MSWNQDELLSCLRRMDAYEFEHLVADVWEQRGWETTVTTGSGDRGIDVIATKQDPFFQKQIIQAKRYKRNNTVGSPDIQQYSSLRQQESNVDSVVIVTTSSFSIQAREIANKLNVKLVNGTELSHIILENDPESVLENYDGINQNSVSPGSTNTESATEPEYGGVSFEDSSHPHKRQKSDLEETVWSRILPDWLISLNSSGSIFGQCPVCRNPCLSKNRPIIPTAYTCNNCGAKLKEEWGHLSIQSYYTLTQGDSELVGESKKVTEWRKLDSKSQKDSEA